MNRMLHDWRRVWSLVLLSLMTAAVQAQETAATEAPANPVQAAFAAAKSSMQQGPSTIELRDQAALKLPEGYTFVPQQQAAKILDAMGNSTDSELVGMVVGEGNWFVVVDYSPSGYIKDEEAKDWDVDGMLDNLKDGTEAQNKMRRDRGIAEMEVVGWVEPPRYESATHRLIWSLSSKDKGAPADSDRGINYNTYLLGREGYVSMNLVTGLSEVEGLKGTAQELLAATTFKPDKRYEDFNASTDHVAEYGIAALVGGLAIKKLGLLAVIAAFALKAWKLGLIAVFGAGSLLRKILGNRKQA